MSWHATLWHNTFNAVESSYNPDTLVPNELCLYSLVFQIDESCTSFVYQHKHQQKRKARSVSCGQWRKDWIIKCSLFITIILQLNHTSSKLMLEKRWTVKQCSLYPDCEFFSQSDYSLVSNYCKLRTLDLEIRINSHYSITALKFCSRGIMSRCRSFWIIGVRINVVPLYYAFLKEFRYTKKFNYLIFSHERGRKSWRSYWRLIAAPSTAQDHLSASH